MIKRINLVLILTLCWVLSIGQNQDADSLINVLGQTTNPLDRFDLINNIVLSANGFRGDNIDSTATIELLQIAQKLKNDSLLAISYNWLASFFYQKKGDNTSALEYYFKALPLAEKTNDKRRISSIYFDMALVYFDIQDNEKALEVTRKGGENFPDKLHPLYDFMLIQYELNLAGYFILTKNADSAFYYAQRSHETLKRLDQGVLNTFIENSNFGAAYAISGNAIKAYEYFNTALALQDSVENFSTQLFFYNCYIPFLLSNDRDNEGLNQSKKLLNMGLEADNNNLRLAGASYLRQLYDKLNLIDSAYYYSRMESNINSQIFSQENKNKIQALAFSDQLRGVEEKNRAEAYQNKLEQYGLLVGLFMVLVIALILYRNNRQKRKANLYLERAYLNLETTQTQLIHAEKMASLGELTAGIAHEIQNPLNFVNNFSELSGELTIELKEELDKGDIEEAKAISDDLTSNLEKINHHGNRASDIVKSMLQHSRTGTSQKEQTNINNLADEYLRLSYHGLRAKDKSFNADFKLDLDETLPKAEVIPQDLGRVLLNLINNAFYATTEKAKSGSDGYKPIVEVSTKNKKNHIDIIVQDNGSGIPNDIKEKIFQPFFTTKATGSGTGLGLSMSFDIVTKGHGGEITVESEEGIGTKFIITIPIKTAKQ